MTKTQPDFDFTRDGFVSLRGFLDQGDVAELIANLERVIRDLVPTLPREHVFYEDKQHSATLKQLQHLEMHDEWFEQLFVSGHFRETAEQLLSGSVVPKNLQFFNKPPGGVATPPHQDGQYFLLEPCEAVTMWLAVDQADEETGCVRYVRGSHKRGLRPHARTTTLGFSQGIVDYPIETDIAGEVALPADPGDLLAHHAMTIHRADGNRSRNRHRRALGFIYYNEHARENAAAHADYQRRLAEEMSRAGRI